MTNQSKKRFRDYGFVTGDFPVGERNLITDVEGVKVGHATINDGDDIRTGVTVIDPGIDNLFRNKLPAAIYVGNGFGKLTGISQMIELGTLESPIALTNTLAVGRAMRGLVDIVLNISPDIKDIETINVVVGETNDGFLNRIHNDTVTADHVKEAFTNQTKQFELGSIGAGRGTRAFSWKGGIGSASRVIETGRDKYYVGVLVQTNYGGSLNILGIPVGKMLQKKEPTAPDGSCMVVVATDAPLSSRQLRRVAKRSLFGLVRTGSVMAHGSGDYAIAFSKNRSGIEGEKGRLLPDDKINRFFEAAADATEEAVYDAMFCAETVVGRDNNTLEAIPTEIVVGLLKKRLEVGR